MRQKNVKKFLVISSVLVLSNIFNYPLVYALEEKTQKINSSIESSVENRIDIQNEERGYIEIKKNEIVEQTKKYDEKELIRIESSIYEDDKDEVLLKGYTLPNHYLVVEQLKGVEPFDIDVDEKNSFEVDEKGAFEIRLPYLEKENLFMIELLSDQEEVISKKEVIINEKEQEKESSQDNEVDSSVEDVEKEETADAHVEKEETEDTTEQELIEENIKESETTEDDEQEIQEVQEELPDIYKDSQKVLYDSSKKVIVGTAYPISKIEIKQNDRLIDQLVTDEDGNFLFGVPEAYFGSTVTVTTYDEKGDLSKSFDIIIDKQKVSELPQTYSMEERSSDKSSLANMDIKGKTYHYVKRGQTLKELASAYTVTVKQLLEWNPSIINENSISAGTLISIDGKNVYNEINKENATFRNPQEFITYIAPIAQDLASKNDLYASVMIAQAAHESAWGKSALATLGNNLSGVKGSYNGNSVVMLTWEEINGKVVWIEDHFRLYPSYREALNDYVDKLVNGLSYSPKFYEGTWIKNTASHMDATEWLTGRYATDSLYGSKLNNTISSNNLTKFDTHIKISDPIQSQRHTNYIGKILRSNISLYSEPYGSASYRVIGNTSSYMGRDLVIKQEKVNHAGIWIKLYNGSQFVGWMKKSDLGTEDILSSKNTSYAAKVVTKVHSIDSEPYGTEGFHKISTSEHYYNENVLVTKEAITKRGTFAYIVYKGKGVGWIDKRALKAENVLSSRNIQYAGQIMTKNNSIDTLPYGINGFKNIGNSSQYYQDRVLVTQENTTQRGTFVLISYQGKQLGWIDKRALSMETVTSSRSTSYVAQIITNNHSIDSLPYGINGFKNVSHSSNYQHKNVLVSEEKVTPRGSYAYISYNGKGLGWIDKRALSPEVSLSSTTNSYGATIITKNHSIDTLPYGLEGFKKVTMGGEHHGKQVTASKEVSTRRGTFVLISLHGKELGWIDKKALEKEKVISEREIQYAARITGKNNSIDSLAYGLDGFVTIARSTDVQFYNKNIIVKKEIVTDRGIFAYIQLNGKGLGWIDKKALDIEKVLKTEKVYYHATIKTRNNSIDTKPYGTEGFEKITSSDTIYNQKVLVVEEKTTTRGTFVRILKDKVDMGWIDKKALEIIV